MGHLGRLGAANLLEADLRDAVFLESDLREAMGTRRQLRKARSLEAAIMPDGTVHD